MLVESEAIRAMMADQVYLQAKLLDSYGISPSAAVSQELTEAVALIAKERQPSHAPAHEVHEQLADN